MVDLHSASSRRVKSIDPAKGANAMDVSRQTPDDGSNARTIPSAESAMVDLVVDGSEDQTVAEPNS